MIQQRITTLEGRLVILRKPEYKDEEILYKWYNNQEFRKLYSVDLISTKEQINNCIRFYKNANYSSVNSLFLMILNKKSGEPLGVSFLDHISSLHKHARFSIGIAEDDFRKRGFGFDATVVLLNFAFNDLHVHRVWTEVYENNQHSIAACLKFGLRNEGIMRDHIQFNANFRNLILFSLLEDEYHSLPLVRRWGTRLSSMNN